MRWPDFRGSGCMQVYGDGVPDQEKCPQYHTCKCSFLGVSAKQGSTVFTFYLTPNGDINTYVWPFRYLEQVALGDYPQYGLFLVVLMKNVMHLKLITSLFW